MKEARESVEKPKETFQDLRDAVEEVERNLKAESTSSRSTKHVPQPTLGDLLQLKIT